MANEKNFQDKAKDFINNVEDSTKTFDKKDIESGKGMGILSYILPFIPFFAEKNNKFVVYHAKQGMNLLMLSIAYSIVYGVLSSVIKVKGDCGYGYWGDLAEAFGTTCKVTPWWVTVPLSIIGLGITLLAILGIVNVCKGKAKELPIVNKIKIFK